MKLNIADSGKVKRGLMIPKDNLLAIYPPEYDGLCVMGSWLRPSADLLLADYLRGELERGRWSGKMPGVIRLARELGAARNTVEKALKELEREGLLAAQGHGCGRVIVGAGMAKGMTGLRVGFLPYEASDRGLPYLIDLQHRLKEAGHRAEFSRKTLLDLRRDVGRVGEMVEEDGADAWVVVGGPQEVLEWFEKGEVPVFALFGRRRTVSVAGAGPDKVSAMREAVRHLCRLGHRRIVHFVRSERRKPQPGAKERAFLEELAGHGISTGRFHLPEWEETPGGFLQSLDSLFAATPPTALILDEGFLFVAAQLHLAQRGILAPRDVSLVCCDPPDAALAWMRPSAAHIRWDHRRLVRRMLQWVENVSHGRRDLRQTEVPADFVEGGTIGPVP